MDDVTKTAVRGYIGFDGAYYAKVYKQLDKKNAWIHEPERFGLFVIADELDRLNGNIEKLTEAVNGIR